MKRRKRVKRENKKEKKKERARGRETDGSCSRRVVVGRKKREIIVRRRHVPKRTSVTVAKGASGTNHFGNWRSCA